MKLSELQATREDAKTEMRALLATKDEAARDFTEAEEKTFDALEAKIQDLTTKIARAEKEENARKQLALDKSGKESEETKVAKKFSFTRAIDILSRGRKIDGVEAEVSQEAEKELRGSGQTINGIGLPSSMLRILGANVNGVNTITRDLTAGGSATGLEYIQTLEAGHQFGLEIAPKAFGLGVDVLAGLTSNIYITETGEASAVWETEVATNDETTPATSKPVNLSPKRLGAFTDISKQLLIQTSGVAESRVRTQLQKAMNRKLDHTIFQGTGVAPIPTGITATSNINTYSTGGVPSRQSFLDMWKLLADDNAADLGEISIATTAAIYAFLEGAYLDAGSGRFVLENGRVNGKNIIWSNNVAADTIIMGSFDRFVVGQWGGLDLVVNPYTKGKEATIEVIVNAFFDMGCYRPTAFCVADDVTLV